MEVYRSCKDCVTINTAGNHTNGFFFDFSTFLYKPCLSLKEMIGLKYKATLPTSNSKTNKVKIEYSITDRGFDFN